MRPIYSKFDGDDASFEVVKKGSKIESFISICAGKGVTYSRH